MQAGWMSTLARAALVTAALAVGAATQAQTAQANAALLMYKGADRDQRVLEKAKQEGTVSVYTSLSPTDAKPLVAAFESKYGVKVEMWRGQSEGVVQRVLTEARARRSAVDVVETNGPEMESIAREKVLSEFYSPNFKDLPAEVFPKHRLWVPDRLNFYVVAYNTNKVKAEDIPKNYEGFLDPKWKGRLALEANDSEWMGGLVHAWGDKRGMEFFRRLATEQKPELRKGHILLMQLIASGEVEVGLASYYGNAASAKLRGGAVQWAAVEPVIARPQGIGISRTAPHPNAALLFADFMLSPEAQTMLGKSGRGPVSRAAKSETSSLKYVLSDPSVILDESGKWEPAWDKLFMSR
ncbi:MAG: futA [Ramlibacter sp.]|jgi:iron(III) transport system substrate-binding protein|nr:futA [Ramlibacter sp.]